MWTCSAGGEGWVCDREVWSRGLCRAHYGQNWRKEPLRPIGERLPRAARRCTASGEGWACLREHYARGLCKMHAARARYQSRTAPPGEPQRVPLPPRVEALFSSLSGDEVAAVRCWLASPGGRVWLTPRSVKPVEERCRREGCGRAATDAGLCRPHYRAQWEAARAGGVEEYYSGGKGRRGVRRRVAEVLGPGTHRKRSVVRLECGHVLEAWGGESANCTRCAVGSTAASLPE